MTDDTSTPLVGWYVVLETTGLNASKQEWLAAIEDRLQAETAVRQAAGALVDAQVSSRPAAPAVLAAYGVLTGKIKQYV